MSDPSKCMYEHVFKWSGKHIFGEISLDPIDLRIDR
jgi:hypothetical protein